MRRGCARGVPRRWLVGLAATASWAVLAVGPANGAPGGAEALLHFGVATAPFDLATLPEAKGHGFVFLGGAHHPLAGPLALELRVPVVLGSVAQPAGSYLDAAALGNPQLGARTRLLERRQGEAELALSAALEVGVPLASHASDLLPNRLLSIADAIEGHTHPEWFVPGVLPITPSTALRWVTGRWSLGAELRLPLLVRVAKADLPSGTATTNAFGFATVLAADARYRLSERLALAAGAHLAVDAGPVTEHVRKVSRVQDLERLSLHIRLGARVLLIVDLQAAVAGPLAGAAFGGGFRSVVRFD